MKLVMIFLLIVNLVLTIAMGSRKKSQSGDMLNAKGTGEEMQNPPNQTHESVPEKEAQDHEPSKTEEAEVTPQLQPD